MRAKKILYQEVSNTLKNRIISGKYEIGTMLPTENELVDEFEVSKITVRRAVQLLVDDGYVQKQSGKGTVVLSNRAFNYMNRAQSFTSLLTQKGKSVENEIISIEKIEDQKDIKHKLFIFDDIYRIRRKYIIDNKDTILFCYYVSLPDDSIFKAIEEESDFSLYSFLANNNIHISTIKDSFGVCEVSKDIKDNMEIDSPYVLRRTRESVNINGRLIEKTYSYYNTEENEYEIMYEI